jgi:hypothetical protein
LADQNYIKFDSGMTRSSDGGKVKYDLVLDGPMFQRWAEHMTAGSVEHEDRNWMKANGPAEYLRFRRSALRHFIQWWQGETGEDHAAAVFFNINGAEYIDFAKIEEPGEDTQGIPDSYYRPENEPEWTPPVKGQPAMYRGVYRSDSSIGNGPDGAGSRYMNPDGAF